LLFIETNFWNVDTAFGLIAGKSLTKEFLLYFCKSFNFKELDKGTTLPSLVKKDLITMSYPKSKEEQKCIVTQSKNSFVRLFPAINPNAVSTFQKFVSINNGLSIVPFLPITVVPFSQIYLNFLRVILIVFLKKKVMIGRRRLGEN
jgi:hypothetical protein